MYKTKSLHTKIALSAIEEYLYQKSTKKTEKQDIPNELSIIRSCFVTLKTLEGKLRGCIGTIKPKYKNLFTEIIRNAVSSAFYDMRFSKLKLKELEQITISVEVLTPPEEIFDINELDPKRYGAIIQDNTYSRGILLPDIEGIDTIEEQIRIIKRKAGIDQNVNTGLRYFRFETLKYY